MKRLLLLAGMLILALSVWGATVDMPVLISVATNSSATIDSQHTDYGDWVRVCSVAVYVPVNDSGDVILQVTGVAMMGQGEALWVGIDTAAGTTDTLHGYTKVEAPRSRTYTNIEVPFAFTVTVPVDTLGASAYDSLPGYVVTMAVAGSTQPVDVKHVVLQELFNYIKD